MKIYKVTSPDGEVYQVEGPDDATDEQLIELAKNQQAAKQGPIEPDRDSEAAMNQARIAGTIAGGANLVGTSIPGAIAGTVRGVKDIATAQPITQTPVAAKQAGLATPGSTIKIGEINRAMTEPELRTINARVMSQNPELAMREVAPKLTKGAEVAGNLARRFIGPYGAVTSAADMSQRLSEGNYGQAAISGIGALGYGMSSLGNLFPPAKIPGMAIGGAADVTNMGIDAITEYIRRMALERASKSSQGTYQAP